MEIKTKFGHLHTENKRYVTYRNKKHYMKKYQGFGISISELKKLFDFDIETILIRYKRDNGNRELYLSYLNDWLNSEKEHDNEGDNQKFISLSDMKYIGEEVISDK